MSISALYSASSALQAFPQGMQSVAHNMAQTEPTTHMQTTFVEGSTGGVEAQTQVSYVPLSDGYTDYAQEVVHSIVYENAHAANAVSAQGVDDHLGVILNMKV